MPADTPDWPRLFQFPKTQKFRVSVCRLEDEAWHEQGLGLAWCERRDGEAQTWLVVEHEKRPDEQLVRCRIKAPLSFRKQETLLFCAATEGHLSFSSAHNGPQQQPQGGGGVVRLALCFQELVGCATVFDFLVYAAHTWAPGVTVAVQYVMSDNGGDIDLELVVQPPRLPPLPTSKNAEAVVRTISQSLRTPLGREFLAIYLDQTNYLNHMYALFVEMEHLDVDEAKKLRHLTALERIRTLWALSDIMKQYFLVGDGYLIDRMVHSDQFVKVIGILEYDRTFGSRKANFRDYYCNHTELKQVITIHDTPLLEKIRRTFRLQLMRDILVRSADDFPFQILKTLIYINQVDIIDSLQNSTTFCDDLFGLFEDADDTSDETQDEHQHEYAQSKNDLRQQGLRFINEVVKISKTFTMQQMRVLYENLTDYGLFEVLNYAMAPEQPLEPKVLVLESLGVLLDFDPQLAARHFRPTIETLTRLICESHLRESDATSGMGCAMQIQACELLKRLVAEEPKLTTEVFFKQVSRQLAHEGQALTAESVQHVLDIVSYSYLRVPAQTMQLIIEHGLWLCLASTRLLKTSVRDNMPASGVFTSLIRAVQTAIQPAAVEENDDLVEQSKQLIETDLIGKVLDILVTLGNVNQMVHSSCLSLLHIIVEGSLRGDPQFGVMAHWIATERRKDVEKLSKALPMLKEILRLEGGGHAESYKENSPKGSASLASRQRPANRKRSTSSEFFAGRPVTNRAQRPRVNLTPVLHQQAQQQAQHAPIDEVDSGGIKTSSLSNIGPRHLEDQGHPDLLDRDEAPFGESIGELLGRGEELTSDFFDRSSSVSPTSPTASNSSYWNHSPVESGPGGGNSRAILLQTTVPGGGRQGESHEADFA